jgi:serine/threonine protein phosphatase PrpC
MGGSLMNSKDWRYAHASAIGAAHLAQNTVCQDRFSCRTIETSGGEVLIAVIADGAGSTSDGQHGAQTACELFTEEVNSLLKSENASVKSLNADFGKRWINYFQQKIAAEAKTNGKIVRDYASTLIAAVVGKSAAAFYQVGDGAIVISDSGAAESYRFAIAQHETEYVNMTDFLTDAAAAERLRFALIEEEIEDLILFSDGIFPVAVNYQANQPHEPFLMPMIAPLRNGNANNLNEKLENFLQTPKINEKTDDDKTIILASRAFSKSNLIAKSEARA